MKFFRFYPSATFTALVNTQTQSGLCYHDVSPPVQQTTIANGTYVISRGGNNVCNRINVYMLAIKISVETKKERAKKTECDGLNEKPEML